MRKKTFSFALSIPEPPDGRIMSTGFKSIKTYVGVIEGNKIARSSRWWGLFKTATEEIDCSKNMVSTRLRSKLKWSEEEATGAFSGESLQDYRHRTSGKTKKIVRKEAADVTGKVISDFLSIAW